MPKIKWQSYLDCREHNRAYRCYTCMLALHRYRTTILTTCLALFLSSVGLPVIVVACEMGTRVLTRGCGGSCTRAVPHGLRLTGAACQAQCHFIERNTTASVLGRSDQNVPHLQVIAVFPCNLSLPAQSSFSSYSPNESPPLTRDIPLLTSTFLI